MCTGFEGALDHSDEEKNRDKTLGKTQELGHNLALCIATAKLIRKDCII